MKRIYALSSLILLISAFFSSNALVAQTELNNESCGLKNVTQKQPLAANIVANATDYQFYIENVDYGFNETITTAGPVLKLSLLAELTRPGVSYEISIRTRVKGVWSEYGQKCQITRDGVKDIYCITDRLAEEANELYPSVNELMDINRKAINKYIENNINGQGKSLVGCTQSFTIPVVFHVLHTPGEALGVGSNISDTRILNQLQVMNDEFNLPNPATLGVNTCIQFCLAENTPSGAAWTSFGSATAGITRTGTSQTNHITTGTGPANMLGTISFPNDEYLNIWVVSTIDGGSGILGYSPFPLIPSSLIDGIVIRNTVVGTGLTPPYHQGKVMVHELGHYLGLYHTFQAPGVCGTAGSSTDGDFIPDTPVALGPNYGCQTGASGFSCGSQDQVQNHMDYSDDACKSTFTQGQTDWMHGTLMTIPRRANMVSMFNLLATGIAGPSGCVDPAITSEFVATPQQACTGTDLVTVTGAGVYDNWTITFTEPISGTVIVLTGTGTPTASTTLSPSGAWDVQLFVSNTTTLPLGTSTTTINSYIFTSDCVPINGCASHWYFGNDASLDFSSGIGVPFAANIPNAANPNGNFFSLEACTAISDPLSGNLAFYSDGRNLWSSAHTITPNGSGAMNGGINEFTVSGYLNSAHKGVVSIPNPNTSSSSEYLIFSNSDKPKSTSQINNGLSFYGVDMSLNGGLGDLVSNTAQHPTQNFSTTEPVAAVSNCDGSEYWIVVHGTNNSPTQNGGFPSNVTATGVAIAPSDAVFSYKVDATGVAGVPVISDAGPYTVQPNPALATTGNQWIGSTKFSINRSLCAMQSYNNGQIYLYDFDPSSGQLVFLQALNAGATCVEFSPSGEFLYTCGGSSVRQYDLRDLLCDIPFTTYTLPSNYIFADLELGPDNKIYLSRNILTSPADITVINYPDLENTGFNPNAFGLNFNGITLSNNTVSRLGFTNTVHKLNASPLDFEFCVLNCFDISTRSLACGNNYEWDFDGDNIPDVGVDSRLETYTFPGAGNYPVTLWVDGVPVTHIIQIIAPPTPLIIPNGTICQQAFPTTHSLSNAGSMPAGSTYTWSTTGGGTISGPNNQASVDVIWASGGTLSVTVTDPNGCASTNIVTITLAVPATISTIVTDASCAGTCDGSVTTTLSGTPSFNITWTEVATGLTIGTSANISGLCPGDYTITVEDGNGCISSETITINSGAGSLPLLTAANIIVCEDGSYTLTAGGVSAGATVEWYGPTDVPGVDPPFATGSPSYTGPFTVGNFIGFQVRQCLPGGCCSMVTLFDILVNPVPPVITMTTLTVCASGPLVLDIPGGAAPGATLEWFGPGASTPFATGTPTFTGPFAPGTYAGFQVRQCYPTGCCSPIAVFDIIIEATPPAPIMSNIIVCEDGAYTLSATGIVAGATVEWYGIGDVPGVDPPFATGSPSYTGPFTVGTFTGFQVRQCLPSGCCSPITTFDIIVNPSPPVITMTTLTVCASGPLVLDIPGGAAPGATLEWFFPGASTPFATGTPTFNGPFTPGTYAGFQVRQCFPTGCCSPIVVFDIIIEPLPPAPVMSNITVCETGSYTLTATGIVAGATVEWYGIGDVPGIDPPFATGNPSFTGPFTVGTFTGFQVRQCLPSGCCSPITTFSIIVEAAPPAPIMSNITVCENGSYTLSATGIVAGATVEWYSAGDVPGVDPPFATGSPSFTGPFTVGTFTGFQVRQCLPSGCCSPITTFDIIVDPVPPALVLPNITACASGPLVLSVTGAVPGTIIEWFFPGASTPFATGSPSFPGPLAPGTYPGFQVRQCFPSGCCSPLTVFDIIITPNLPPLAVSNIIACASGPLTLTFPGVAPGATIEWFAPGAVPGVNPPFATGTPTFTGPFAPGTYSGFQVWQCLPSGCCSPVGIFDIIITPGSGFPKHFSPGTGDQAAKGNSIAYDEDDGSVYLAGWSTSTTQFLPSNSLSILNGKTSYVAKYSNCGDLIWVQSYGPPASVSGIDGSQAYDIAIGPNGDPYLTGMFIGNGIDFGNSFVLNSNGNCAYIQKIDPLNGQTVWAYQSDAIGAKAGGTAIAVDDDDRVFITGRSGSLSVPLTFGLVSENFSSPQDIFTASFDNNGTCLWIRNLGISNGSSITNYDIVESIAVNSDIVYISGAFRGKLLFGALPQVNSSGLHDIYLAAHDNNTGNEISIYRYGGGSSETHSRDIKVDDFNNVYMTGFYDDKIVIPNGLVGLPLVNLGGEDGFVMKIAPSGNAFWVNNLGGVNGDEQGTGIGLDINGEVYISGKYRSSILDFGSGVTLPGPSALNDGFIAKYDNAGNIVSGWITKPTSSTIGYFIVPWDIVVANDGTSYITGLFKGTVDFSLGTSPALTSITSMDGFIAKTDPSGLMAKSFLDLSEYQEPKLDTFKEDKLGKWYPNPSHLFGYYEYELAKDQLAELEVCDIFGKVIFKEVISGKATRIKIDLQEFSDGMYFYRVIDNKSVLDEGKIVISH